MANTSTGGGAKNLLIVVVFLIVAVAGLAGYILRDHFSPQVAPQSAAQTAAATTAQEQATDAAATPLAADAATRMPTAENNGGTAAPDTNAVAAAKEPRRVASGTLPPFPRADAMAARVPAPESADDSAGAAAPVIVGRIYNVDGDLLRYVPETRDWVAQVADAPFGQADTLSSGRDGRAELIVPNQTWVRIGNSTQIQFIALAEDLSEVDVASGVARFYNKSDNGVIKATCDFGYALASAGTVFDFYVGDRSAEVVALDGTVTFVHAATNSRYSVTAGAPSLLADLRVVGSGDGTVDGDWATWNAAREKAWAQKTTAPVQYADCLPPALQEEAPVLEQQGQWDRVAYEGSERMFWRPTKVEAGWAPFTVGRWTEWNGDQTWVPAESFGYVTHHYGNWIRVEDRWYWAPPVPTVHARVDLPLLDVGYHWNPGRVSWIHSEGYVGWVPLAPTEVYYGHRRWGGHTVLASDPSFRAEVAIASLAFVTAAVVIHQDDYWRGRDYDQVRVRDVDRTTIVNNYNAAPVVNNTVINNYTTDNRRFNYTDAVVKEKPHNTVLQRIEKNDVRSRQGRTEKAEAVQNAANTIAVRPVAREAKVESPKMVSTMVAASDVAKPVAEVKLPEREVKAKPTKPVATPKPAVTPKAAVTPGQTPPAKPITGAKPTATPKVTAAPKATVTPKATATPKVTETTKPAVPLKPATTPGATETPKPTATPRAPATPKATATPKAIVEPTKPAKPAETPKPAVGPVQPAKPTETAKPTAAPAKPAKPAVTPKPTGEPAKPVMPAKPAETPKPAAEPTKPAKQAETPKPTVGPVQPVKPTAKPAQPAKPTETAKPADTPKPTVGPVQPAKPTETPKPAETPKPTVEPAQPAKPAETPKAVDSPKPARRGAPTATPAKGAAGTEKAAKESPTPTPGKSPTPVDKNGPDQP